MRGCWRKRDLPLTIILGLFFSRLHLSFFFLPSLLPLPPVHSPLGELLPILPLFVSNSFMQSHLSHANGASRRSSVAARPRVCTHCGRNFRRTEHLERHIRTRKCSRDTASFSNCVRGQIQKKSLFSASAVHPLLVGTF